MYQISQCSKVASLWACHSLFLPPTVGFPTRLLEHHPLAGVPPNVPCQAGFYPPICSRPPFPLALPVLSLKFSKSIAHLLKLKPYTETYPPLPSETNGCTWQFPLPLLRWDTKCWILSKRKQPPLSQNCILFDIFSAHKQSPAFSYDEPHPSPRLCRRR